MVIRKVLNSSVVLVQDEGGEESILLRKGIGYGRRPGQSIDRQPSDRVFIPLSNPDAQPMIELFSSIPPAYLELTEDIVADAEASLGVKLSPHIYLMLTFHIVNARQDTGAGGDAMKAALFIGELTNIVTYRMHTPLDTESIHFSRFINHMQFFADRFFTGKLMDSEDDFLFRQMQQGYPEAADCAERIRTFLLRKYNVFLPNEETAYLALHIARLTKTTEDDTSTK